MEKVIEYFGVIARHSVRIVRAAEKTADALERIAVVMEKDRRSYEARRMIV